MGIRTKCLLSIILFVMIATVSSLLFLSTSPIEKQPVSSGNTFWLENNDILLFLEIITQIKNHDLYLKPDIKRHELIQETVRSFLEKTDPYAAYMTADEFTQWKKSQNDRYVGIGMEIVKDHEGQVICLPFSGSPAAMAGIQPGDKLISIEGKNVRGQSVLAIGSMARGKLDKNIQILVINHAGEPKSISVKRTDVSFDSVSSSRLEHIPIIKISAFTPDTKAKLEDALVDVVKTKPLVIDLRGNAGGDFSSAIDAAKLFLIDHKEIVSVKSRQGIKRYESGKWAVNLDSPLFLWQNEGTASAAEVFIAALTQNHRAVSMGKKSFGKGTRQEFIELSDGSGLFMTTGFLQTPDGKLFEGKGLNPDYTVESKNPQTAEYLSKVKELLRERGDNFPSNAP